MQKKFDEDYFIGVDIGTNSIGFAVTDENYKLQKVNQKTLWGVRLFEEGQTAIDRRLFRTARRRNERSTLRIKLLQEIFSEEIATVDYGFYVRLAESKYAFEDKKTPEKCAIFNDSAYCDTDFYKQYPTIYHLRNELIVNPAVHDVRLVYLALHHIIKNRGHFLFGGESLSTEIPTFADAFNELNLVLQTEYETQFSESSLADAEQIIKDRQLGKRDKSKSLQSVLGSDGMLKAVIGLICGSSVKLTDLFRSADDEEDEDLADVEPKSITFDDADFDTKHDALAAVLKDRMNLIDSAKAVYDWAILADILQGFQRISDAKIKDFEKHKKDLSLLKRFVRENLSEEYQEIFNVSQNKLDNYTAYSKHCERNGLNMPIEKTCTQEDFCKYIRGKLTKKKDDSAEYQYLWGEAERNTLLPKQTTKKNSAIPYQINLRELNEILDNAEKYLPFLSQTQDGVTFKEKIKLIFTFRIPYYVGPLNAAHQKEGGMKGFSWIVKRESGSIRPWNFEQKVDLEASAEKFIRRMTNKCTYLVGEDVLPKNSLIYSKFMVLNEINNLRINGTPITTQQKQKLYQDKFVLNTKKERLTEKKLMEYFRSENMMTRTDTLSGFDQEIKASLASLVDLTQIFAPEPLNEPMAEDIIKWIVLFGDEKKMLESKIKREYPCVTPEQIKRIKNLKYRDWARFSSKFLTEIYGADRESGEILNIINALENTNQNLMQLLSDRYTYLDKIEKYNQENQDTHKTLQAQIDELYISPAVKRSLNQSLAIFFEIAKVMGKPPKKIFIEMARGPEEKVRTVSRKNRLTELYKNLKKDEDLKSIAEDLSNRSESDLRQKKLYLYYTQMGRCMYSGERIDLSALLRDNASYDIDHIYPRSKLKDDSFTNTVLVKGTLNKEKTDVFPIPDRLRQPTLWKSLADKEFISKKKYERLTRREEFSTDELAGFINRQLVETRQSTKETANLLKMIFPTSEVVYVAAGNVSDFRNGTEGKAQNVSHKVRFHKCRELNDTHHAKDAYLNIVVGNVYNTKFTKDPRNFIKENPDRSYNLARMYDFDVIRGSKTAWLRGKEGTIRIVADTMKKNNILFTRACTETKGGLFDQMPVKKKAGLMPLKGSDARLQDTIKYGGYNSVKGAYFCLVEYEGKKGKHIRSVEYVPVYLAKQIESDPSALERYFQAQELNNPRILLRKIKIHTLFVVDGFPMTLSARNGVQLIFRGAMQLVLPAEQEEYLRKILKFVEKSTENASLGEHGEWYGISTEQNLKLYDEFLAKLTHTKYNVRLSAQEKNLRAKRGVFEALSPLLQSQMLKAALNLFSTGASASDLSKLGLGASVGIKRISKIITSNDQVKIYHQSPTGLFAEEIDLLKFEP